MGKGSTRRRCQVSREQYNANYDLIFGQKPKPCLNCERIKELLSIYGDRHDWNTCDTLEEELKECQRTHDTENTRSD